MNAVASRSVTFRPELLTAKGHPKSETTITREVQTFASEFEKKILTGAYQSVYRSGGETIVKTTKTKGSLRYITVPAPVIALARQWKSEQAQGRLRIGSKWHSGNCVFTQWDGQRMGLDTPYQAFHRIIRNYNATRQPDAPELPLIPLHGLRHTAATLLIAYGTDVRTVAGRLGHSNTSTTLNIYAEYLNELDRSASDKLDNLSLCR